MIAPFKQGNYGGLIDPPTYFLYVCSTNFLNDFGYAGLILIGVR